MHTLSSAKQGACQAENGIAYMSYKARSQRVAGKRFVQNGAFIRSSLAVAMAGIFAGIGTIADGVQASPIHAALMTFAAASTVAALNWASEKVRDRGRRKTVVEQHNKTRAEMLAAIKELQEEIAAK